MKRKTKTDKAIEIPYEHRKFCKNCGGSKFWLANDALHGLSLQCCACLQCMSLQGLVKGVVAFFCHQEEDEEDLGGHCGEASSCCYMAGNPGHGGEDCTCPCHQQGEATPEYPRPNEDNCCSMSGSRVAKDKGCTCRCHEMEGCDCPLCKVYRQGEGGWEA